MLEAIAIRLAAITSRLEAIASRLEAIAITPLFLQNTFKPGHQVFLEAFAAKDVDWKICSGSLVRHGQLMFPV